MAGYDRNSLVRDSVQQLADDDAPVSSATGPPPRPVRGAEPQAAVTNATAVATPAVERLPVEDRPVESPSVARRPGLAEPYVITSADTTALAGPARHSETDPLPGHVLPGGRRQLFALLSADIEQLLLENMGGRETRGRAIARALKIASSTLEARAAGASDSDPWDDRGAQRLRRHDIQPLRITFQWSDTQARALKQLAERCGEENYSRLISDAIEIAYGSPGTSASPRRVADPPAGRSRG